MEIHNLEPILREHPFFQGLPSKHIELLVGCATNVRFDAGEYICHTGEDANHFHVIRSGKVMIEVNVPQRGPVAIQSLGDGDVHGSAWLFPPYKWTFDARAAQLTRAIALDGKCLRQKCEEDHDLGFEMMKRFSAIMTERLKATWLQLLDLYGSPSRREK